MWRAAATALLLCACTDSGGPPAPMGPVLEVPAVIDLPYQVAGAGAVTVDVTVRNTGDEDTVALGWAIAGDGFAIDAAPEVVAAGGAGVVTLRWDGADTERIAGASLTVGDLTSEVWAVAGSPGLGDAAFSDVIGAGGVRVGASAIVDMPTAPFDADPRVHVFVPDGYRERDAQDLVLHFHGFSTTIDQTVPAHLYREQVYASGADLILVVPQGPVNTASGDFGRLMDPMGTLALLDEVLVVLYRERLVTRPALGAVTLTSHSGGYQAVAANLVDPPFEVRQVDLFDSLYGDISTYRDYALAGGLLRSDYTASGGTDQNNIAFASDLAGAGVDVATNATQIALRDTPDVIYFVASTHEGSTREDGAYGEQLRWGGHASRRGPRLELRTAIAAGGTATVTWLAPHDDDVTGFSVETSPDGATWTEAAHVAATASRASFPLTAGARVRVLPVLPGVDDAQPSDTYRIDPGADVVVVDGFDRVLDGSWGGLAHDFAAIVGESAGAVASVSNEAITEDGFDLSAYRTVIWLVGDESTADHTFTQAERDAIDAYLAGGGKVILSGSEIGYELGSTNASWLASTVGAAFASDNAGSTSVHGSGVADFTFAGPGAPYLEEFPDTFTATGGGAVILQYATGAAAAVGIAGRGVIVGFPLELIDDPTARANVIAKLVAY